MSREKLQAWMASADPAPPLLLTGGGTDQLLIQARLVALGLLCSAGAPTRRLGCGECVICRQVESGAHPDSIILLPEQFKQIKQVRSLRTMLGRRPLWGRRVVVLHGIEQLSGPASAALLKTLEEPALNTRFVLTTPRPRRVLLTIRSRCQQVFLAGLPLTAAAEDEFETLFQHLSQQLRAAGPTPALRRSLLRLRDYYKIRSLSGNTKLARAVLVASLPPDTPYLRP